MSEQFLVVEVVGNEGVRNVYVSLDQDEQAVANGFRAIRESGEKTTGTISRMERVNGVMRRVESFASRRLVVDGYRTLSAFLRV